MYVRYMLQILIKNWKILKNKKLYIFIYQYTLMASLLDIRFIGFSSFVLCYNQNVRLLNFTCKKCSSDEQTVAFRYPSLLIVYIVTCSSRFFTRIYLHILFTSLSLSLSVLCYPKTYRSTDQSSVLCCLCCVACDHVYRSLAGII